MFVCIKWQIWSVEGRLHTHTKILRIEHHVFDFEGHVTSGRLTIRFPIGHFLLAVLWNQAYISNGFGDIQRRMSRSGWRDLDVLMFPHDSLV